MDTTDTSNTNHRIHKVKEWLHNDSNDFNFKDDIMDEVINEDNSTLNISNETELLSVSQRIRNPDRNSDESYDSSFDKMVEKITKTKKKVYKSSVRPTRKQQKRRQLPKLFDNQKILKHKTSKSVTNLKRFVDNIKENKNILNYEFPETEKNNETAVNNNNNNNSLHYLSPVETSHESQTGSIFSDADSDTDWSESKNINLKEAFVKQKKNTTKLRLRSIYSSNENRKYKKNPYNESNNSSKESNDNDDIIKKNSNENTIKEKNITFHNKSKKRFICKAETIDEADNILKRYKKDKNQLQQRNLNTLSQNKNSSPSKNEIKLKDKTKDNIEPNKQSNKIKDNTNSVQCESINITEHADQMLNYKIEVLQCIDDINLSDHRTTNLQVDETNPVLQNDITVHNNINSSHSTMITAEQDSDMVLPSNTSETIQINKIPGDMNSMQQSVNVVQQENYFKSVINMASNCEVGDKIAVAHQNELIILSEHTHKNDQCDNSILTDKKNREGIIFKKDNEQNIEINIQNDKSRIQQRLLTLKRSINNDETIQDYLPGELQRDINSVVTNHNCESEKVIEKENYSVNSIQTLESILKSDRTTGIYLNQNKTSQKNTLKSKEYEGKRKIKEGNTKYINKEDKTMKLNKKSDHLNKINSYFEKNYGLKNYYKAKKRYKLENHNETAEDKNQCPNCKGKNIKQTPSKCNKSIMNKSILDSPEWSKLHQRLKELNISYKKNLKLIIPKNNTMRNIEPNMNVDYSNKADDRFTIIGLKSFSMDDIYGQICKTIRFDSPLKRSKSLNDINDKIVTTNSKVTGIKEMLAWSKLYDKKQNLRKLSNKINSSSKDYQMVIPGSDDDNTDVSIIPSSQPLIQRSYYYYQRRESIKVDKIHNETIEFRSQDIFQSSKHEILTISTNEIISDGNNLINNADPLLNNNQTQFTSSEEIILNSQEPQKNTAHNYGTRKNSSIQNTYTETDVKNVPCATNCVDFDLNLCNGKVNEYFQLGLKISENKPNSSEANQENSKNVLSKSQNEINFKFINKNLMGANNEKQSNIKFHLTNSLSSNVNISLTYNPELKTVIKNV